MLHVFLQPFQLLSAKAAQPSRFQIHDVNQPDKMHAILVEAVPARSLGAFPVALQILLAVVVEDIMLAGHKEDVLSAGGLQELVHSVELSGFGEMADVAGVQHESGSDR